MSAAFIGGEYNAATIYGTKEAAERAVAIQLAFSAGERHNILATRCGRYKVAVVGRNDAFLYWL